MTTLMIGTINPQAVTTTIASNMCCQETEDFKIQVIAALESPDGPKDLKTLAKLLRDLSSEAYDKIFASVVK